MAPRRLPATRSIGAAVRLEQPRVQTKLLVLEKQPPGSIEGVAEAATEADKRGPQPPRAARPAAGKQVPRDLPTVAQEKRPEPVGRHGVATAQILRKKGASSERSVQQELASAPTRVRPSAQMLDQVRRVVHHGEPGAQHTVVHIAVVAAGIRRTRAEAEIERSHLL